MTQAVDRDLTRLGAPPYEPRTGSAAVQVCEVPERSSSPPSTSAAPAMPVQQPAAEGSSAAPAVPTVASSAPLASPAAPATGAAQYVLVLQRLGLREELAAPLVPHMPQILQHLLPGSDLEKRQLQFLLISGYDPGANWPAFFVEQLKWTVHNNALACVHLLPAVTDQAVAPSSAATPSATVPAALQAGASRQGPAMHNSMAEPSQQLPHGSEALPGDAQGTESVAAPPAQAGAGAVEPVPSGQQPSATAPVQGVTVAPRADIPAVAADVSLAVQTAPVHQQPRRVGEALPESASPAAKVSAVVQCVSHSRAMAVSVVCN